MDHKIRLSIKAIALDLDGTLLHTAPDLAEAANRMLTALNIMPIAESVVMSYIGNGVAKLIKRALTGDMEGEPDASLFECAQTLFFKHYQEVLNKDTKRYPGVIEGLNQMKEAGFRLACITNKLERFTLPLLKEMALFDYFEIVVSGDNLSKRKPDPMPLRYVCEQLSIAPYELVMVGDSVADMEAARSAGCHAFFVPYGYNRGLSAKELNPDKVIDTLIEITKFVCLK